MEQNERYQLIFSGDVLPGHDPIKVGAKLAGLFRLSLAELRPAMNGERLILQYDISYKQAVRYQTQLETFGAKVSCEPMAAPTVQVWEDEPMELLIAPPLSGPVVASPLNTPREDQIACPSCGQVQPRRTLCISCSVDIPRFIQAQEAAVEEAKAAREAARQATLKKGRKEKSEEGFKYDNYGGNDSYSTEEARIWGFSLGGRLGRCHYFLGGFAIAVAAGIAIAVGIGLLQFMGFILAIPVGLIGFYMMIRLIVLRLHDLNLSGWWALGFVGIGAIGALSPMISAVLQLIGTVAIVLWPGTSDDNDYGPQPEAPSGLIVGLTVILGVLTVISSIGSMKYAQKATSWIEQIEKNNQE